MNISADSYPNKKAKILPEFPTGNGAIDLIIRYQNKIYGLGLKSYTNDSDFRESLKQAARYAKTLNVAIIHLVVFVEYIPDEYRMKYESDYADKETGVTVQPVFVATYSESKTARSDCYQSQAVFASHG